ncbi:protein kinase domain-containing protein [Blastopirellula marina]|uniref:non-specific serine/threonine protein kinase n=1 Tax=Blastopirellula marina DSM 3645 TaxID=314230 RepID=A3ZYY0_9BACT|nr:protein kinase [Blastopirellula marina]EAQ78345.1 serine/threonine protein kinase [Blastopirellula marina DSM 3645]
MNEQQIFHAALKIADPLARSQYLDLTCGNDSTLRGEVESLLAAHARSGEFLDIPVLAQLGSPAEESGETREHPNGADSQVDLSFLEPSQKAGSLGRLSHYEVRQVLGRGGCGIVFKAFDEKLQRTVAIKVIAPELSATSPARKRFLREARAAAGVRHNSVVSIYAVENLPIPYLVMEYLDGGTMQDKLDQSGPFALPEILLFGRQIAEGLAAAHAQGLIHRDIKPCNILLDAGGQSVKLSDFGLARTMDDARLTQSGAVAGTPLYMSPEQARGETLDQRSDLFSLGSVLYVMCSGRPPFRAPTHYAVMKRVVEDAPRPIPDIIPEIPATLTSIIDKLLEKDRADRIPSAAEVATRLRELERRDLHAVANPFRTTGTPPAAKFDPPPRTSLGTWIALVTVCLIAIGVLLAGLMFNRSLSDPSAPRGVWVQREDQLMQTEPLDSQWIFGDPNWSDYNMDVETRNLCNHANARVGSILFRAESPHDFYRFTIDNVSTGMTTLVKSTGDETTKIGPFRQNRPQQNPWYKAHIEVRKDRIRCWVDDIELFDERDSTFARGRVGLATIGVAAAWRNLKVTKPDGSILWEGFPKIEPGMFESPTTIRNYPCGEMIMPAKLVLPPDVSPDRRAAAYVLSAGGSIRINGERFQSIRRLDQLPDEPFELTQASLNDPRIKEAELQIFAETTHLTELALGSEFTDAALQNFRHNKNLKTLYFLHSQITGAPLHDFDLSQLTHVDVRYSQFDGGNVIVLQNSPELIELHLTNTNVQDEDLALLTGLSKLQHLHLYDTRISDAGLAQIGKLTKMKILSIDKTEITDKGIAHLTTLHDLEVLNASNTNLTDVSVNHLAQLPRLQRLQVQGTQITRQAIEKLHAALPDCVITWNGGEIRPAGDAPPTPGLDI